MNIYVCIRLEVERNLRNSLRSEKLFECTLLCIKEKTVFQCTYLVIFFSVALRPNAGHGLLNHEVSRSYTTTHHSRWDSSGRVISSSHKPLPDNTQQSQQTNIHAPGGVRTQDLSRRAAVDLRLRRRGHWDWLW
jgi:hypothetical protein